MAKIGIIFPGQGAQYPEWVKSSTKRIREIRELYENAEKIFPGITEISFHGTADDLKKTENTQPALYLAELCGFDSQKERYRSLRSGRILSRRNSRALFSAVLLIILKDSVLSASAVNSVECRIPELKLLWRLF